MRWQVFTRKRRTSANKSATPALQCLNDAFFLLSLLTFIGKHSFWGVRWTVIVSTADFANDTPLPYVTQTELTPNSCNCDRQPIKCIPAQGPAPSGTLVFLTHNLPSAGLVTHSDRRTCYKTLCTALCLCLCLKMF